MCYGHPRLVRQWAKAMKPVATPAQLAQAHLMRQAKQQKSAFLESQLSLFCRRSSAAAASPFSPRESAPVGHRDYQKEIQMKKLVSTLGAALTMFAVNASAAVDPAVSTAISDGLADGKTIAGGLLGLAVAVGIVLYIKRKAG